MAPPDDGMIGGIVLGVPLGALRYVFGFTMPDLLFLLGNANAIGTIVLLDALRHSQFPVSFGRLNWVLMAPHMHHAHHSTNPVHYNKNLGENLSIWDWLTGESGEFFRRR